MSRFIYIAVLVVAACCISCAKDKTDAPPTGALPAEVEILIGSSSTTRSPVPDEGHPDERYIAELDLMIFEGGVYKYRREAYKMDEFNRFKATLVESDNEMTCYLLANCRTLLAQWDNGTDQTGKDWPAVQAELVDASPVRLVDPDTKTPLPMWAQIKGTVSTTQINTWGPVELLRSVASVDLYVEKNGKTSLFTLTDLYIYYGPDKGYLAPSPDPGNIWNYTPVSPPDMKTSLTDQLHVKKVESMIIKRDDVTYDCDAIAFQAYLYDNDVTSSTVSADKKFSRAILAGYYDQTGPQSDWKKSYYPLDFVYSDGRFRPIVRNWKYEFRVEAVTGPGYSSLEEAAENYPIHINVDLVDWDREGVEIGVTGKYYVSIERRLSYLTRYAGSRDEIGITYRIYDDIPGERFTLSFEDDANGTTQSSAGTIQNDYFKVALNHDTDTQSASLTIEALRSYDRDHCREKVIIGFRDLEFNVDIRQLDSDDWDWEWGGNQDEDLGE